MGIRTAKIINFESVKTSRHGNNSYWSRDASSLNGNTDERRKTLSDWGAVPRKKLDVVSCCTSNCPSQTSLQDSVTSLVLRFGREILPRRFCQRFEQF